MPDLRKVAKKFSSLDFSELEEILDSPIHEERLLAVIILADRAKKADKEELKKIVRFYLKKKRRINNWDIVDVSVPHILGRYFLEFPEDGKVLDRMVLSKNLWERRMAIVSTLTLIRNNQFQKTLDLAEKLLDDREDLMHKAVGWMLREVWKKDSQKCEEFLIRHYSRIPRTALRYAIERMEEKKRKKFLKGEF